MFAVRRLKIIRSVEFLYFKKTLIFLFSKNHLVNFCILNEDFFIPKIIYSKTILKSWNRFVKIYLIKLYTIHLWLLSFGEEK